jgi:hypothetical protein
MRVWKNTTGCCFFLMLIPVLYAQNTWKLQKEKDGIKISSRASPSSSFDDIRVEADFPGRIEQLAAILLDINRYPEWAYGTKKSVLIKNLGPGKLIYYSEIDIPWPASDRFYYANLELKMDTVNRTLLLVSANIPGYEPIPRELVAVPYTKGVWNVRSNSSKSIHIDYTLELNPGSSMPAWVLNLFATRGPLETFENIRNKMLALNHF